jgi:hypothetical protein
VAASTADLVTSLLFVCGFLITVSATHSYTRSFIIPGVTIMMFLGAISVVFPLVAEHELANMKQYLNEVLKEVSSMRSKTL